MTNQELKLEADAMVDSVSLAILLDDYAEWSIGGSYSYDLMCWRDLDVYVLSPAHQLEACFTVFVSTYQ